MHISIKKAKTKLASRLTLSVLVPMVGSKTIEPKDGQEVLLRKRPVSKGDLGMSDLWRRLEVEMERLSRSKGVPSLQTLEDSGAPENRGLVWAGPEDTLDVPDMPPGRNPDHEETFNPSSPLVATLAGRIKKILVEIRSLTESSQGKFKDPAFGQEFYRRMTERIDNSEMDLTCFLDYLRIKSAVRQTNSTHIILEEALEKHKKELLDKEIRIFKKQFEKDLPEPSVHVEELRFLLNWVLEYAILSAVPHRGIGFLTRTFEVPEGKTEIRLPQQRGTKCIEILIVIGDYEKPSKAIGVPPTIGTTHNEGERNCILPLLDEIVQKNRGVLKLSADGEGCLRMISLVLPVERRQILRYERALA